MRPRDAAVGAHRLAPVLERAHELRVDGEAVGHAQQLLVELAQAVGVDGRRDVGRGRAVELVLAGALLDRRRRREARLQLLVLLGELLPDLVGQRVDLVLRDDAGVDQLARVERAAASGGLLIVAYISGCVYAGSSASLWPKRR